MKNCDGIWLKFAEVCIPIYVEIPPWKSWPWQDLRKRFEIETDFMPGKLTNPEDVLKGNAHLKGFIEKGLLEKSTLIDLVSLHHISDIAKNLSPELKETLGGVVKELQNKVNEKAVIG